VRIEKASIFKSMHRNNICRLTGVVSLQCEVCGREIIGKPHRVIIEGAKVITCAECAKLGSDYWTPDAEAQKAKKTAVRPLRHVRPPIKDKVLPQSAPPLEGFEIVEGFGQVIRRAREKMGLTPEDLGKRIGEKESVIKKIENEKIMPDARLATKLEHALKIKLLVKPSEVDLDSSAVKTLRHERNVTLGEVVRLKDGKRGGEELEREQ